MGGAGLKYAAPEIAYAAGVSIRYICCHDSAMGKEVWANGSAWNVEKAEGQGGA